MIADIETSPNIGLFWKSGFKLNIGPENIIHERKIVCICWKWEGEATVYSYRWDSNQDDKRMLQHFIEQAGDADEIIGHNGDSFDWPWVRTRALIHGLTPIPAWKTIDTLQWARRYFCFNSNKLDYLGKVLGHGQKIHTEFGLWKKVVLDNDLQALKYMVKYCGQDVRLLEKVWASMRFCVAPKTHAGVFAGLSKWTCPSCASEKVHKSKTRVTAAGNIQHQMHCQSCGSYYHINQSTYENYQEEKYKVTVLPDSPRQGRRKTAKGTSRVAALQK
jgi:predicted RNA-binding Zn-ribbon protein involved in translation (DUF1610 family)